MYADLLVLSIACDLWLSMYLPIFTYVCRYVWEEGRIQNHNQPEETCAEKWTDKKPRIVKLSISFSGLASYQCRNKKLIDHGIKKYTCK